MRHQQIWVPVLDPFLVSLAIKMLAAAAVVIVAALMVERSGPFLGAMIVTLPISTGPSYVFLAMEHPPEFMAATALSSLVANAATPLFMATYALLAQRRGLIVSLGTAVMVWVGAVAGSTLIPWTLPLAVGLNVALYAAGGLLVRNVGRAAVAAATGRRWWDLPLRAITVMALCGAVIVAARFIGPQAAGLVALAPMGFISIALVVHPRAGGRASAAIFASAMPGMVGFVAAVLVVHLTVVPLGSWTGLGLALAVSVFWNLLLVGVRTASRRRSSP